MERITKLLFSLNEDTVLVRDRVTGATVSTIDPIQGGIDQCDGTGEDKTEYAGF